MKISNCVTPILCILSMSQIHFRGKIIPGGRLWAKCCNRGRDSPQLELKLPDGGKLTLPGDAPSRYTALLFYRGHW